MKCVATRVAVSLGISLALINAAYAAEYYVTVDGTPSGNGSLSAPWDLDTALAQPTKVLPGDTIWIRGGVYCGSFTSNLTGAPGMPIQLREYPGERATLDGAGNGWNAPTLTVNGAWTWYRDFEITNSAPRVFGSARAHGVEVYGPNTKLISLIIHDNGQGVGLWTAAPDAEAYGNLIYNNGWDASDRGHGHNIYTQNQTGFKYITNNIMLSPFSYNLHVYSTTAPIDNFQISKNILLSGPFLVGGQIDAHNITADSNLFYASNPTFGYGATDNAGLTLTNNYVAGFTGIRWWSNAKVNNNTFIPLNQSGQDLSLSVTVRTGGALTDYAIDRNSYFKGETRGGWDFSTYNPTAQNYTFPMWTTGTGWDLNSQYVTTQPVGTKVVLQPNQYDADKANLAIYNWDKLSNISVDLSSLGFKVGDVIDIHNAQNYFAEYMTVTYTGGPVSIPMTGWSAAMPVGVTTLLYPVTFPEFGVFVVERRPVIPINVLVTPGQATLLPGQTQQFTANVEGTTNTAVTWSLSSAVGTISSAGLYTAPATATSTATVQVIATSVADPKRKAYVPVTIQSVTVAVSPSSIALTSGKTQQFTATVAGTSNTAVKWSLSPASGTISASGLYTAPASVTSNSNVTVKATSLADSTKAATATVMLTPNINVSMAISPTWVSLKAGQSQQFTVNVYGTTNQNVTWSLSPAIGTITSNGVYTAPYLTTKTAVTITATSAANRTKTICAVASVEPFVGVKVNPAAVTLGSGQTYQFTTLVSGLGSTSVTWSLSSALGTISPAGLYTAPTSVPSLTTVTVKATSVADPTKFGTATVTLTPITVSVSPANIIVRAGKTQQYTATVAGTSNTAVTWSISPAVGKISSTGLYTAPSSIASSTVVTVKATSVADPTKFGTVTLTVK